MRLEGKTAFVTGAGSVGSGWGNGRAIACRFAEEGATVYALDYRREALDETLRLAGESAERIIPVVADLKSTPSTREAVESVIEQSGRVDVLVNNVGGSRAGGVHELSEEEWWGQLDFNLTTAFRTMHEFVPHMRLHGGGAIINLSSTSGIRWTGAAQAGYSAAKAAVIQLSRSTAVQNGPHGIRVNTIVPGQLHTPMVEARLAGQRSGGDVESLIAERVSRIPLGFAGDGRDTANAAVFLASEESRFVTGTEIVVDGGMSARCD